MADNPFAQFAAKPSAGDNPFAKFAAPVAPEEPGALTKFGRSAASLADVALSSIINASGAIAGQITYPIARAIGQTPEQATAFTRGFAGPAENPVGNLFGVTNTPEYQAEATRRLTGAVGRGLKSVAEKTAEVTGLPPQDVGNMAANAALLLPQVPGAIRAGKQAVAEIPVVKARAERIAQEESAKGWARAAKIDAAKTAKNLGLAINPAESNPTLTSKTLVGASGNENVNAALTKKNAPRVEQLARKDTGIPEGSPLTPEAFEKAREIHYRPYGEVGRLGTLAPDQGVMQSLADLRLDPRSTNDPAKINAVNATVERVISQIGDGLTGQNVIGQIRGFRKDASRTLSRPDAKPVEIDVAEVQLNIANALENLVEANIADASLLTRFRDARTKIAKSHDWERATNPVTHQVDVSQIVKLAEKGKPLTGTLAEVAQVAGNYPKAFSTSPKIDIRNDIQRGGLGGTVGYAIGSLTGAGGILGGALGASASALGGRLGANLLARESAQNRLAMPIDPRLPLPVQEVPLAPPTPRNRAIVPYKAPQQILGPGEGPYQPNWVFGDNPISPIRSVTPNPASMRNALPAPSAESTMNALRTEDARRAALSRALGQEEEARIAAAERAARRPTTGEVILDLDPTTGRFRTQSEGLKGATPDTFRNYGASLESAADKVANGRLFDMTAEEKVAWNKTRVDLAKVAPGFEALSEKAIAEKMLDRQWVQQTVDKAREKAAAFEQIAKRANDEQARRNALANRERMMELADEMEQSLSRPRPVVKKSEGQGPKTRAFRRNQLTPEQTTVNKLTEK